MQKKKKEILEFYLTSCNSTFFISIVRKRQQRAWFLGGVELYCCYRIVPFLASFLRERVGHTLVSLGITATVLSD